MKDKDLIIDIFYDKSLRLWTALLLDEDQYQQGDAIYSPYFQEIINDAIQEWGDLRAYKDVVNNGINKPLN